MTSRIATPASRSSSVKKLCGRRGSYSPTTWTQMASLPLLLNIVVDDKLRMQCNNKPVFKL